MTNTFENFAANRQFDVVSKNVHEKDMRQKLKKQKFNEKGQKIQKNRVIAFCTTFCEQ